MIEEECRSCGYALAIHGTAGHGVKPDPNGGCPTGEADAVNRWSGWLEDFG